MPTIHLAPIGAQYTVTFSETDGKPVVDRIIAEPKIMLCGLGLPLTKPIKVVTPLDHASLCADCTQKFPERKSSIQPVMYA